MHHVHNYVFHGKVNLHPVPKVGMDGALPLPRHWLVQEYSCESLLIRQTWWQVSWIASTKTLLSSIKNSWENIFFHLPMDIHWVWICYLELLQASYYWPRMLQTQTVPDWDEEIVGHTWHTWAAESTNLRFYHISAISIMCGNKFPHSLSQFKWALHAICSSKHPKWYKTERVI